MISLWLPVAAWMAAIYYGAGMSQVPGPASSIPDTVLHAAGYAGLAVLTLRATAGGRWSGVAARAVLLALIIATLHGLSVEVEQMFVPTRTAEWRDVGNDIIGALIGLLPIWAWATMRRTTP